MEFKENFTPGFILFHISFNFFETIGVALYELFLIFIKFPLCEPAHSVFKMAISKLLIICLYQVTKNRYLSKQHSVLPMKQLILYILLSFCSIVNICLNAKIGYSVTIPETDKYIGYLTIIITVFINLHIMWLLEYIIENQKLKSKIARSEQQANLQLKYYKQLDANYQKSLQMIHDIDKHVNTIEQLYKSNEFEKADNYIKGMDRLISDFVLFPYSNNTVLNLILNEKRFLQNNTAFCINVPLNKLILDLWMTLTSQLYFQICLKTPYLLVLFAKPIKKYQ